MKKIIMLSLLLSGGVALLAQTRVTGFVLDGSMNYEPLIGATVMVKGTNTGTTTDVDGNFSQQGTGHFDLSHYALTIGASYRF